MLNLIRALRADVNIVQALSMSFRGTLTRDVVRALKKAKENEIDFTPIQIESHVLAGGKVLEIVDACIALKERYIDYDLHDLMVIDLSQQNIAAFITAFLKAHSRYMDLTLDEFKQRYYMGENVVEDAMKYRFEPWKHMKSWQVRITYVGLGLLRTYRNQNQMG